MSDAARDAYARNDEESYRRSVTYLLESQLRQSVEHTAKVWALLNALVEQIRRGDVFDRGIDFKKNAAYLEAERFLKG